MKKKRRKIYSVVLILMVFASCKQPINSTDNSADEIQNALEAIVTYPELPASFNAPGSRNAFNPADELNSFKMQYSLTYLFMRVINEACTGKVIPLNTRHNFPHVTLSADLSQSFGRMPVKDFTVLFTKNALNEMVIQSSFVWDLSAVSQPNQYIVSRFIASKNESGSYASHGWIIAYNKTGDVFSEDTAAPYTYLTYTRQKQEVFAQGLYKKADTNGTVFNYIENNILGTVLSYANATSGGMKKGSNFLYFTESAVTAENSSIKSALDTLSNQNNSILVTRPESAALSSENKTLLSDWLISIYGGSVN